jgi:hypothetical protein
MKIDADRLQRKPGIKAVI